MKLTLSREKRIAIAIIVAASLIVVGLAYAAYTMTSNPVAITVNSQAALTLAAAPSTTFTLGETVVLTATCTDTGFTGTVTFTANGASIGSQAATAGVASITWQPAASGSYTVTASASHT